jgi:hypothetical protein
MAPAGLSNTPVPAARRQSSGVVQPLGLRGGARKYGNDSADGQIMQDKSYLLDLGDAANTVLPWLGMHSYFHGVLLTGRSEWGSTCSSPDQLRALVKNACFSK